VSAFARLRRAKFSIQDLSPEASLLVAVGDLHGDWQKAIASLVLAGVVRVTEDGQIVWVGGDTVVVQLGDVLDRGDHEIGR
jgi:hypothetical protein